MYSRQIDYCMRNNPLFLGVYSINTLHSLVGQNGLFIFNEEEDYKKGKHWMAVVLSESEGYFFDSYGRMPPKEVQVLKEAWKYNPKRLQSIYSSCCGQWCIDFCNFVSCGNDPTTYHLQWGNSTQYNDSLIEMKIGECNDMCVRQTCEPLSL